MKKNKRHHRELLALSLIPKLGIQRIKRLLRTIDRPQEIFRQNRDRLKQVPEIGSVIAKTIAEFNDWDEVDRLIEATERIGAQIVTYSDEDYPDLLKQIYDPPVLFWLYGNPNVLNTKGIAIVGTRRASAYGKETAKYFTEKLVEHGLTIVSGLAYGIDAVAHKTALEKSGTTIAVLGSGINRIYPEKHRQLARDIAERGGAVITEFPLDTPPDAGNFPVRNRIVSGLTLGTLVVESGVEGGSIITAKSALDQNREVFAVPHSLTNRMGEGCNRLIKSGQAKLVQQVEDILVEIPVHVNNAESEGSVSGQKEWRTKDLDEISVSICKLLEDAPRHIDDLGKQLNLPVHVLLPKLLELEMQSCVRQNAGKMFQLL